MGVIVPAILPTSREDLESKLALLEGLVDTVQIDIVDGRFATPATWPYVNQSADFADWIKQGEGLAHMGNFRYEMDLMVQNVEDVAGLWIAGGAQRIVLHAESTQRLPEIVHDLSVKYGHAKDFVPGLLSFGLSIGNGTDLALLDPYMGDADFVQFMGIADIGKQGQPFDPRVLEKVRTFRRKYPDMTIQVDGAVSLETAPHLLAAGVDRLVVGSGLWRARDIKQELTHFNDLLQEYGVFGR